MEFKNKGIAIYFPIVIAVSVVIGILIGRFYSGSNTENKFIIIPKANKIDNVLNYIENEYVDDVSKAEIIERAIPKILEDLDPHSQYIPAMELQKVNEPLEGNFSGIGIQFNMLNDTLVVIQTLPMGPHKKWVYWPETGSLGWTVGSGRRKVAQRLHCGQVTRTQGYTGKCSSKSPECKGIA